MKVSKMAFSTAAVSSLLLLSSLAALAAASPFSVSVPVDTVIRDAELSKHLLASVDVPQAHQDQLCAATLTSKNNVSIHPGTNVYVDSGNSLFFADVENGSFVSATQELLLSSQISVSVELGEDGVFSGGLLVDVLCPEQEPTPTSTVAPTQTPTVEPTPTNTVTPTPTRTVAPTPTATPLPTTVAPPTQVAACIALGFVPPLPESLPSEGFVTDIYVDGYAPNGFLFHDGTGVLHLESNPLVGMRLFPNVTYRVSLSESDAGCEIERRPTSSGIIPQPIPPDIMLHQFLPQIAR